MPFLIENFRLFLNYMFYFVTVKKGTYFLVKDLLNVQLR